MVDYTVFVAYLLKGKSSTHVIQVHAVQRVNYSINRVAKPRPHEGCDA
jgi:hypothetical protein